MTDTAAGLDPDQAAFMMSGVRIDLVDKRASDWANERILDPLQGGQSRGEVVGNLIDEHINWSIEHSDWDQASDNFHAASLAGGPEMVNAIVDQMGVDGVRELLRQTALDDPRRLVIYEKAFAGSEYEALVWEHQNSCQIPQSS